MHKHTTNMSDRKCAKYGIEKLRQSQHELKHKTEKRIANNTLNEKKKPAHTQSN